LSIQLVENLADSLMAAVAKRKVIDPTFGRRLHALRKAAGLTQSELAEKVGMLHQNVARLEKGGREPGWYVVVKLAEALGVPTDAFRG
jgi:putative transcriptional regulator